MIETCSQLKFRGGLLEPALNNQISDSLESVRRVLPRFLWDASNFGYSDFCVGTPSEVQPTPRKAGLRLGMQVPQLQ